MDIISHRTLPRHQRGQSAYTRQAARTCSDPNSRLNARLTQILRELDTEDVRFAYGAGRIRDSLRNVKTGERMEMTVPFCDMGQKELRDVMAQLAR